MAKLNRFKLTRDELLRILADVIIVNISFLLALMLRYLWEVGFEGKMDVAHSILSSYLLTYLRGFWFLTIVSIIIFYSSGFYTYGRAYRSKYKILIILQAVSIGYAIFGAYGYFTGEYLPLPRGAYFLSYGITLINMNLARFWSELWRKVVNKEKEFFIEAPENRKIQNILVIGGAGYIGSALLIKLLDHGFRVRLLDLLLFGEEPIQEVKEHSHLEIVRADFRQVDKVVEAMRNMDAVIHLGAIVGDPACALDEDLTIDVNLMATKMIAEVAKGNGVERFIFASTCSVYGASDQVLDERSVLNPVSLYARSKIASERVLIKMADSRFFPVILRFSTIYGLSGRTRFDLVVNLLTAKAIVDGKITIFGGNQWRPFVHVNDAALAIFRTLEAPLELVRGEIFNVGSDEQNYTIQQIGELIHKIILNAKIVNMGSDTDARNYKVSFRKIRKNLHFIPHWSVEKGIKQVEEAIRSGKVRDYRDAQFSNVKFLSEEGASLLIKNEKVWMDLLEDKSPIISETSTKSS